MEKVGQRPRKQSCSCERNRKTLDEQGESLEKQNVESQISLANLMHSPACLTCEWFASRTDFAYILFAADYLFWWKLSFSKENWLNYVPP